MDESLLAQGLRMAVFIDADNLLIAARDAGFGSPVTEVMRALKAEGIVSYACAYGDWSTGLCRMALGDFRRNVINMVELSVTDHGKNSADIALAVDAMEMICSELRPQCLVLVSGDRDFVPLVLKARRHGVLVMGVGVRGSVSGELVTGCDRFMYLDDLLPEMSGVPLASTARPQPKVTTNGSYAPAAPVLPVLPATPEPAAAEPTPTAPTSEEPAAAPADEAESAAAPAAPGGAEPQPTPTPVAALEQAPAPIPLADLDRPTVLRALAGVVESVLRAGQIAYGARVCENLRERIPGFAFEMVGFSTFRELVQAAVSQGLVTAQYSEVSDLTLGLPVSAHPDADEEPLSFDTPDLAAQAYTAILATEKQVPLVQWVYRYPLVEHLWIELEAWPRPVIDMNVLLMEFGRRQAYTLPERAYKKITHTLNIARCFTDGHTVEYFQDIAFVKLSPAVQLHDALAAMHETYLRGIIMARPDVLLETEAVAIMLYGPAASEHLEDVDRLIDRIGHRRHVSGRLPATNIGARFGTVLGGLNIEP